MAQVLPTPETDEDDIEYAITLGGVRVLYRLRWMPVASGWYLRLSTTAGTVISDWHVLAPQRLATYDPTAPGHPPGRIVCAGVGDGSRRGDLFSSMQIQFIADAA